MNKAALFIITHGDIFEQNCIAYVNPVNCIGVMGSGLAREFKRRFPEMFAEYSAHCREKKLYIGQMFTWLNMAIEFPKYIICFPTKVHYQNPSTLRYIEQGVKALKNTIISKQLHTIAIPALGCGLGGLDFDDVLDILQKELYDLRNVRIYIHPPKDNSWKKINA